VDLPKWELPPVDKIHEAYSAIADNRVMMFDTYALVKSSDYTKEYIIEWDGDIYSSNDNASYFQRYLGYPVIAVLMLQRRISYSPSVASHYKGIRWKTLNTQYKNKYSKVVEFIMSGFAENCIDVQQINNEVACVFEQIKSIDIFYRRSTHRPPK